MFGKFLSFINLMNYLACVWIAHVMRLLESETSLTMPIYGSPPGYNCTTQSLF